MNAFYKTLTTLAALLVIAYACVGLIQHYQFWQSQKSWETEITQGDQDQELPGITLQGEANLEAFVSAYGESLLSFKGEAPAIVVPIVADPKYNSRNSLVLNSASLGLNWYSVGDCDENPIVNLVYVDLLNAKANTLYSRRVFIPAFGVLQLEGNNSLIALFVDKDSDGNGRLTCSDLAHLEIIDLETKNRILMGIEGLADSFSVRQFNGQEILIVLDRQTEDKKRVPSIYKLDVSSGKFEVLVPPDLLTGAQKAFED